MKELFNMGLMILLIQCNNVFSAQPTQSGWLDKAKSWVWSKFQSTSPALVPVGAAVGYKVTQAIPDISYDLGKALFKILGLSWENVVYVFSSKDPWYNEVMRTGVFIVPHDKADAAALFTGTLMITAFYAFTGYILKNHIDAISKREQQESRRQFAIIQQAELLLGKLIENNTLYPTRSSKIRTLMKKDDFLYDISRIISPTNFPLIERACAQLSKKISDAPYSIEQKERDREIDKYMSMLTGSIEQLPLDSQMNVLKIIAAEKPLSPEQMEGFLSIYYRVKNKLKMQEMMAVLEENTRPRILEREDPFGLEAVKKMTSDERKKPVTEWEAWKKSDDPKAKALKEKMDQALKERQTKIDEIKKAREEAKTQQAAQ